MLPKRKRKWRLKRCCCVWEHIHSSSLKAHNVSPVSCYQLARRTPGIYPKYDCLRNSNRAYWALRKTFHVRPEMRQRFLILLIEERRGECERKNWALYRCMFVASVENFTEFNNFRRSSFLITDLLRKLSRNFHWSWRVIQKLLSVDISKNNIEGTYYGD